MIDKEIVASLAFLRIGLRKMIAKSSDLSDSITQIRRTVKRLEDENLLFNKHRIDGLENESKRLSESRRLIWNKKADIGRMIVDIGHFADEVMTLDEKCQVLNVNVADRSRLPDDADFTTILYGHRLADSAEWRGKDFSCDALGEAVMTFFQNELISNKDLAKKADNFLFGTGGMFEFLPTYRNINGEMVRNPPKLRLACDVDKVKAA